MMLIIIFLSFLVKWIISYQGYEVLPIKNVEQSLSKFLSNNVSRSMDGNLKTCAAVGNYQSDPWWTVELERVYDVKSVIISQEAEKYSTLTVNKVAVYVSLTDKDFKEKFCFYHEKPEDKLKEASFNLTCHQSIMGKYVTLLKTEKTMLILCEVVIYGSGFPVTLSFMKATYQNDFLFKSVSNVAVDGNNQTCTRIRAPQNQPALWRVTLDTIFDITLVVISYDIKSNESASVNNLNVFVSNDFEDFEEHLCANLTSTNEDDEGMVYLECPNPIPGKYITIKKHGGPNPGNLFLCEVYVYGDSFDITKVCKEDEVSCGLKLVCIPRENICDGIKHCPDNFDERNCGGCPASHYQCTSGQCIHQDWLCDSTKDCPYGDDENNTKCSSCSQMEFKCLKNNKCIPIDKRCDGGYDCSDYSDENECLTTEKTDAPAKAKTFLKAIYKAEPDFFICSTNWWSKFSMLACKNMDRAHISTTYLKVNTTNILTLKTLLIYKNKPFLYSFEKSEVCKSGKFIQLSCSTAFKSVCGKREIAEARLGPYIINGDRAALGAWPWHVQLVSYKTSKSCGGTLLQYNWVLSSSNCLENAAEATTLYAKLGTVKNDDPLAKRHHFSRIIHLSDRSSLYGDIALLKFNDSVALSPYVRPVCLPPRDVLQMFIPYCVVTGFGNIDNENFGWSWYLRQGRMNILGNRECKQVLIENGVANHTARRLFFSDRVFCGGSVPTHIGVNLCRGDFGGAMSCKLKTGRWAIVGVASNIVTDLMKKKCLVSIFNKIDPYLNVINKIITID